MCLNRVCVFQGVCVLHDVSDRVCVLQDVCVLHDVSDRVCVCCRVCLTGCVCVCVAGRVLSEPGHQ